VPREWENRDVVISAGLVEKFIYSVSLKSSIGWETLKKIAIGISRGLEYLRQGCGIHIIHFDINPHNILVDEDLCPKIYDFELAKLCQCHPPLVSLRQMCFYRGFGVVSTKSDVYSYEMMILEMVRGRTDSKEE
jgi:serine/threonine protein kinase